MAQFKFKRGQVLVDKEGEMVVVLDNFYDAHTYEKDYQLEVLRPGPAKHRKVGKKFFVDKSICESWFELANPTEQVLYGR